MNYSTKNLIRFLWLLVLGLALTAGYFQAALETERKKSAHLEAQLESRYEQEK